jgi:hypothetical protein
MNLNLSNVERLVFYDQRAQRLIPHHQSFFNQWKLAQMTPALRPLGKRAVLDFLNALTSDDIKILEIHFDGEITLTRVNYSLVSNQICLLDEAEGILSQAEGFVDFAVYRDNDCLYISHWR